MLLFYSRISGSPVFFIRPYYSNPFLHVPDRVLGVGGDVTRKKKRKKNLIQIQIQILYSPSFTTRKVSRKR